MATTGTKLALLLGLFVAASMLAAARPIAVNDNKGTITIYNPAVLAMDIATDDKNVKVTTGSATLDIAHAEQDIQISVGDGEEMDITVHDGDMLFVIPDPDDAANLEAFKVVMADEEPQPSDVGVSAPRSQVVPANIPGFIHHPPPAECPMPCPWCGGV